MVVKRSFGVSEMRTIKDVAERVYRALSVADVYTLRNVSAERSSKLVSEVEAMAEEKGLFVPSYSRSFKDESTTFFYSGNGTA